MMGFENANFQEVVAYTINRAVFRCDKPPFDDVNIRKAVCYAIDLKAIIENIVGVTGVQARNTTVPPNMPGSASDELEPIPFDLDKAKEFMAQSSMPDGFSTQIHVEAPHDIWVPQAIAVQEALKAINIDVEVVQYPHANFITMQQNGDYEWMQITQWGADFPDAAGNLIPVLLSTNVPPQNNYGYYSNSEVDRILNESETELDQEKRLELLKEAQRIASDDQPMIYFEHFKWFLPTSTRLTGYTLSPLWYWDSFGRDLVPAES
jgi:peptide/nickel transport system substrate-binding protein